MNALRYGLLAIFVGGYVIAGANLNRLPRPPTMQAMRATLPLFAQVGIAAGDRYLAANIAGFRALFAEPVHLQRGDFRVLAQVQRDVAWLNPAHEDNYYIGAAILPWSGEVDASQYILRRAMDARPFDWQPVFYYSFGLYHFKRQPAAAATSLLTAKPRMRDENDRMALENVAARWAEKGYSPKVAAGVVESMAAQSQPGGFQRYLLQRAARLRALNELQAAAEEYRRLRGQPLRELQELVDEGLVERLPTDPFGFGYAVSADGQPILRNSQAEAQR